MKIQTAKPRGLTDGWTVPETLGSCVAPSNSCLAALQPPSDLGAGETDALRGSTLVFFTAAAAASTAWSLAAEEGEKLQAMDRPQVLWLLPA